MFTKITHLEDGDGIVSVYEYTDSELLNIRQVFKRLTFTFDEQAVMNGGYIMRIPFSTIDNHFDTEIYDKLEGVIEACGDKEWEAGVGNMALELVENGTVKLAIETVSEDPIKQEVVFAGRVGFDVGEKAADMYIEKILEDNQIKSLFRYGK